MGDSHTSRQESGPSLISVELPFQTVLPAHYITDREMRMRLYRRMAELDNEHDVKTMLAELTDRFGPAPQPVHNLIFQLRVKLRAHRAHVDSIGCEQEMISIRCPQSKNESMRDKLLAALPPDTRIAREKVWISTTGMQQEWEQRLLRSLDILAAID